MTWAHDENSQMLRQVTTRRPLLGKALMLIGLGMAAATCLLPSVAEACHTIPKSQGGCMRDSGTSPAGQPASSSTEMLVYDWNKPVTKSDSGFPRMVPPPNNKNWKSPVDFTDGDYYIRIQIKKQPKPQKMRIQFCVWQDNLAAENCTRLIPVTGNPGTVVTTSQPITSMWTNGKRVDYSRSRQGNDSPIWNSKNPVSSYSGYNWSGENPNLWYPLDMRYTVVVVKKGAKFSGWQNYIK
jgi:hypothetical protein